MNINGENWLACLQRIDRDRAGPTRIAPLPHMCAGRRRYLNVSPGNLLSPPGIPALSLRQRGLLCLAGAEAYGSYCVLHGMRFSLSDLQGKLRGPHLPPLPKHTYEKFQGASLRSGT